MTKRIIATLLTALMLVSVCSCGGAGNGTFGPDDGYANDGGNGNNGGNNDGYVSDPVNDGTPVTPGTSGNPSTDTPDTKPAVEEDVVEIDNGKLAPLPSGIELIKIGSTTATQIQKGNLGYAYAKGSTISIATYDGKSDVSVDYSGVLATKDFFSVTNHSGDKYDADNLDDINCLGLVDVYGKLLIPAEYAYINVINERYVTVYKATGELPSKDGAPFKVTAYSADDGVEHYYSIEWFIYDTVTCQKVDGATGTTSTYSSAKGAILSYRLDDKTLIKYSPNGILDENVVVFTDGSYLSDGVVYNPDGSTRFTPKKGGFEPSSMDDDCNYYVAKKYSSGGAKYVVMDKTGKVVSAEFEKSIYVRGKLIESNYKIYTFDGKQVIDSEIKNLTYDCIAGVSIYYVQLADRDIVLDGALNTIYEAASDTNIKMYTWNGSPRKQEDKTYYMYCYAAREFIQGYHVGFMTGYSGSYNDYTLKDAITGNTLITGSKNLEAMATEDDSVQYIISKTANGYDFYLVQAK